LRTREQVVGSRSGPPEYNQYNKSVASTRRDNPPETPTLAFTIGTAHFRSLSALTEYWSNQTLIQTAPITPHNAIVSPHVRNKLDRTGVSFNDPWLFSVYV